MDRIYLDNNATTSLLPEVWEAMRPHFLDYAGNPASSHGAGRRARQALETAREQIAELLDAPPRQVIFTSGATEANNLAITGLAGTAAGHLVISPVEHPCVTGPIQQLVKRGFLLSQLPITEAGVVCPQDDFIPADTRLVAVMLANHEVGTIQPVETLAARVAGRAPFHCDAAAAVGKIPVCFRRLGVTSLTMSAHKLHGPGGIGALVVKDPVKLRPLFWGGHQQQGTRPGTEPVPLVVGMATALAIAVRAMDANRRYVLHMREILLGRLREQAAPVLLNGPEEGGIPHTINLSFPGCQADTLLMSLDLAGVACSTGSACSSGSLLPSPVLRALAVSSARLHSSLRFSLSSCLSVAEIEESARRIIKIVKTLRCSSSEAHQAERQAR